MGNAGLDPTPLTINHPHVDVYSETLDSELRNYVDLFLSQGGISSTSRALAKDLSILKLKRMVQEGDAEYLKPATGRVFEHLAHLWIAESMDKKDTIVVNPVATNNLFRILDITNGANVFPDGVMIKHDDKDIVIEHLFKYKMNPFVSDKILDEQI